MKKFKLAKSYLRSLKRWLKQPYKAKLLNSIRKNIDFNNSFKLVFALLFALVISEIFLPMQEAVIANGEIMLDNSEQELTFFKDVLIKEIYIKEGDYVEKNQSLILFNDSETEAKLNVQQSNIMSLEAERIRLIAQKNNTHPNWPSYISADIIKSEQEIYDSEKEQLQGEISIANNKISELEQKIQSLATEKETLKKQLELLNKNVEIYKTLIEENLESVLQLNRAKFQLINAQESYDAIELEKKILEESKFMVEKERELILNKYNSRINSELIEVLLDLYQQKANLEKAQYVYDKRFLTAPTSGAITDLKYFHPNTSIKAAEKILGIIPNEDKVLINAFVIPQDIENIKPNQKVRIYLPKDKNKYNTYYYGKVLRVGANLVKNEQGAEYFNVDIEMEKQTLNSLYQQNFVTIGSPVEVHIKTDEFGLLSYLISPFVNVHF